MLAVRPVEQPTTTSSIMSSVGHLVEPHVARHPESRLPLRIVKGYHYWPAQRTLGGVVVEPIGSSASRLHCGALTLGRTYEGFSISSRLRGIGMASWRRLHCVFDLPHRTTSSGD